VTHSEEFHAIFSYFLNSLHGLRCGSVPVHRDEVEHAVLRPTGELGTRHRKPRM
jgi:hypothetical protein